VLTIAPGGLFHGALQRCLGKLDGLAPYATPVALIFGYLFAQLQFRDILLFTASFSSYVRRRILEFTDYFTRNGVDPDLFVTAQRRSGLVLRFAYSREGVESFI
jgi:hypothetical protein